MGSKFRYSILILYILLLITMVSDGLTYKIAGIRGEIPLQEQIVLSRGGEGFRPEILFEKSQPKHREVTVMTFNICHGVNLKGEESLDPLIESIRGTGAHIIGLQEVDRFMPRSKFKDQAKNIAQGLGYHYVYGETINIFGIKYGNAIISKFPILEYENIKLPGDSIEARALLRAKIDVEGSPLEVYTIHLGLNAGDRERQVEAINSSLNESLGPLILMGDFNAEPTNKEMADLSPLLLDIAVELQREEFYTYAFHSDLPNTRIDRIYISKDIDLIDHYVLDSGISDHFMVLGVISTSFKSKEGLIVYIGNNNK